MQPRLVVMDDADRGVTVVSMETDITGNIGEVLTVDDAFSVVGKETGIRFNTGGLLTVDKAFSVLVMEAGIMDTGERLKIDEAFPVAAKESDIWDSIGVRVVVLDSDIGDGVDELLTQDETS